MSHSFWSHRTLSALAILVLLSPAASWTPANAQDGPAKSSEQFFKEAIVRRNAAIEKARQKMADEAIQAQAVADAAAKQADGEQVANKQAVAKTPVDSRDERNIRFTFDRTPWRDVIDWLAEEGNLALHLNDIPTGSFTYSDPGTFTHQEAIDRVNLFLLPEGYTLVRSGKLLTVINLSDKRSMQQLDAIATLVTVAQLQERNNFDVVKCIFPLGEIKAEDAAQELSVLSLMTTPVTLAQTNQLMITDTVSKLKNVKVVLDAFTPAEMENGTVVKNFALKHVKAEDILLVARPHMGLATGEMIGIDVSLSSDLEGENIFATGVADKIKLLDTLVAALDIEKKSITNSGNNVLKSHTVEGGNVETVYNVLTTLLADKEVRLSMDNEAGSVVAYASPEVQKEIADTVTQLQASEADFEVIPLKTADPYFVISLLEEMLNLPDALTDPEDIDPDTPKIDADPGNMRLFVRAKRTQIDQIKKIVAGLDSTTAESSSSSGTNDVRVIPLKGDEAKRVLETASKFWRSSNPIILYASVDADSPANERIVVEEETTTQESSAASKQLGVAIGTERVLSTNANDHAPAIRCQVTARGILLACEDTAALDRFEEHLRTIAGPLESIPSPPVVFYLKYTKASDAITMLAELLDGGESAREGEAGTLVNGFVSASSSSFLGSFVTSRDGTTTMMAGSITVVADTRLNRLIAQGTGGDIERIEGYLKIIDKDNSITSIETFGTSHVVELANARATEVADVLRQAFAGRVNGSDASKDAAKGTPEQQKAAAAAAAKAAAAKKAADKKNPKGTASTQTRDLTPKMTIAVHEPSNALIITAPEQLFKEAEKLAMTIDARAKQEIEILSPMNGDIYEAVLMQMLGQEPPDRERPSSGSSSRSTSSRSAKSDR